MSDYNFEILSPNKPIANEEVEKEVLAYYWYFPTTPSSLVKAEYFYTPKYREIFSCIQSIQSEGKTPSEGILTERILQLPKTDKQGHPTSVPTIDDLLSISENITDFVASSTFHQNIAILKEYAAKRELRNICYRGLGAIQPGSSISAENVLREMSEAATLEVNSDVSRFSSDLHPITEENVKSELSKEGGDLKTGYFFDANEDSDKELLIPDRAITFVVAPTSHGKSTMLENLALRIIGRQPNKKVLYLTYEESQNAVLTSFLSIYCAYNNSIPSKGRIKNAIKEDLKGNPQYIANDQREAYKNAKKEFFKLLKYGNLNIRYKDYDTETLISYIKYMKSNNACDVVLIDYTQLLSLANNGRLSRQEQLKQICLKLKNLAVSEKYGLPIILAAQFNRQVVSPLEMVSTNIGEAGDIERVANTIVALWNCNFSNFAIHKPEELNKEFHGLGIKDPTKIYAKIIKRREQQPNVSTMLDFDGKTGLIDGGELEPHIHNEGEDIPF